MDVSRAPESAAGAALGDAAAAWASSRRIQVGGRSVRYREAGSGSPVVLVHGLGVSADYWVRNGPPIAAAGFRVLAPDLPGFGRTSGPRDGIAIGAQAEALRTFAHALDLESATFVGHSLSCQTVLEIAVAYPAFVRSLVLAAPTGDGDGLLRLPRQALGFVRDIRRESPKLAALVLQAYLRAGPRRILRTWKMASEHDPVRLLPLVRVPTLIIVGDDDPIASPDFARRLVGLLADGHLRLIPGGVHAIIFEPAGEFNRAIIEFLAKTAPPRN